MFSSLRKLIGNIHIATRGNRIAIEGLPADVYFNDVYKIWRTSKIADNMFSKATSASVTFNQFFLPDVLYTIEEVLNKPRRGSGFNYRALRKVVEEIKEQTWIKRTFEKQPDILDFSQLSQLKWALLPHQKDFLATYNDLVPKYGLNGYMLGATPGSGKTYTGIVLSVMVKADVTVAIVPKNAVDRVWAATLDEVFYEPQDVWTSLSGDVLVPGKKYYVFHYEQLDRAIEFFKKHQPKNPVVLLDESHNMNEADSLRTTLFVELTRDVLHSKHVLWMSGTPIKAIGNEAIPFLSTVDPLFDQDAEDRFRKIFGKSASRAVTILANRIGYLVFKVERDEVIGNDVKTFNKDVEIPNGRQYTLEVIKEDMRKFIDERMAYYATHFHQYEQQYNAGLKLHEALIRGDRTKQKAYEVYRDYIDIIRPGFDATTMKEYAMYCNRYELKEIIPFLPPGKKEEFKNARSVVKYYDLKVRGEALGRVLGKKRAQCHVDMVPYCELEQEIDSARKKTVIFTSYVEVVDKICETLEAKGYKPLRVYGETNKDLPAIVERFKADEDVNPLVATFQSLSTAVPLIMASTAILMNSPFRVHEYEQATARVDRIGQDGPVNIVNMFLKTGTEGNISTRSNDIMEWSKAQVDAIMGRTGIEDMAALEALFEPSPFGPALNMATLEAFNYSLTMELCEEPTEIRPQYLNW